MAEAQVPGRDLILVVDLSQSMVGAGGAPNIFARVQATLRQLVAELAIGDAVTLVTFDAVATAYPTVTLLSEAERQAIFDQITRLEARGQWTFTAEGLAAGLREAERLAALRGAGAPPPTVLVLTDGLNDPPPAARATALSLDDVTRPYAGRPWFVYQVQLGSDVDGDLEQALEVFPNARTIHDPGGVRLPELSATLAEPPAPSPDVGWRVEPASIEIVLDRLDAASEARVLVSATVAGRPAERIEVEAPDGDWPAAIRIQHEATPEAGGLIVTVAARLTEDIPDGQFMARLRLRAVDVALDEDAVSEVPVLVAVTLPRPWPGWVWPLLAVLALAAAAGVALRARRARLLFGSLDISRPGEAGRRQRVDDLSTHGTHLTVGRAGGISLPGVDQPIAALSTIGHEGRRHVVVRPAGNATIVHEGRSEVELVLYDGDEFEIAGWRLRYRGEVERRRARR